MIEATFEKLALLSGNDVFARVVAHANERTRYVRLLSAGDPARLKRSLSVIQHVPPLLREGHPSCLVDSLDQELESTLCMLPALVDEGVARSYAAAMELKMNGLPTRPPCKVPCRK